MIAMSFRALQAIPVSVFVRPGYILGNDCVENGWLQNEYIIGYVSAASTIYI
jgi:hypothetical protein